MRRQYGYYKINIPIYPCRSSGDRRRVSRLLWLREGKSIWVALAGAVVLILYGIIPTLQPASFGRVYAAYGGAFVVMSILWGWKVDNVMPDRFDLIGGLICLAGVGVIMYWPRG